MPKDEYCAFCGVRLTALNSSIFDLNLCLDCEKTTKWIPKPKKKKVKCNE